MCDDFTRQQLIALVMKDECCFKKLLAKQCLAIPAYCVPANRTHMQMTILSGCKCRSYKEYTSDFASTFFRSGCSGSN